MARKTNPFGKGRKFTNNTVEDPYAIYRNSHGWEWRVMKTYQHPYNERDNPYARWFCAVSSPMTHGSYDLGDVYVSDILGDGQGKLSGFCPEWINHYNHHPKDMTESPYSDKEAEGISKLLEALFADPIFDQKAH
jgi:hypothetical protein